MSKDAEKLYDKFGDKYINSKDTYYAKYHEIRLETAYNLIKKHKKTGTIFDFGCGSGEILQLISDRGGYKFRGSDISAKMVALTKEKLQGDPNLLGIDQGGLELFQSLEPGFDVIISLNVLPYLKEEEEEAFYRQSKRLLNKGGVLLVSHTNVLFDLVTFNRYTIEFYEEFLLPRLTCPDSEKGEILGSLKSLLTDPDFPKKEGYEGLDNKQSERDLLNKRRVDPFTYPAEIEKYGFRLAEMAPINCFPFPPRILTSKTEWGLMQLDMHKNMPNQTLAKLFSSQFQLLFVKQ